MKKKILLLLMVLCATLSVSAQIGYQVTVFDETKKEPKANQPVEVSVTITDNTGKVICTENVNGTTDEFGILSMQIGNATTFSKVDWRKLPLWISAKVDGVTISKTQVLNVPVAEHANHTGALTEDILCSKAWSGSIPTDGLYPDSYTCTFHSDHTGNVVYHDPYEPTTYSFTWTIWGNMVLMAGDSRGWQMYYFPEKNSMVFFSRVGIVLK